MLPPKKSLGQNFLRDENIARKIVESLRLDPGDVVVEIGPGQGHLTRFLLDASPGVIGIEVDHRAVGILRERFGDRLEVLEQDVLLLQLQELAARAGRTVCLVGNIPYYITSDILFWLYDQRAFVKTATLMMQLEVANRLVAQPNSKEYGILSVLTQFYSTSTFLFRVSRNSFFPRPQVDSAVLRFEFSGSPLPVDERLFRNVVRCTFGARRKTLRNGLRMMGFPDEKLASLPFDLAKRPEHLPLSDFVRLTNLLAPHSEHLALKF